MKFILRENKDILNLRNAFEGAEGVKEFEEDIPNYVDYVLNIVRGGASLKITQYKSRKLFIQGRFSGLYNEAVSIADQYCNPAIEDLINGATSEDSQSLVKKGITIDLKTKAQVKVQELIDEKKYDNHNIASWIGTDESGKGDYFGPLVVAGVFVNGETKQRLIALGAKDSKKLSDAKIRELAMKIKSTCKYSIVPIGPEKYNELYDKIGNLNKLLAWGHARAIENIGCGIDQLRFLSFLMRCQPPASLFIFPHGQYDIAQ